MMEAKELWQEFVEKTKNEASYNAWAFGAQADELANLVLQGTKTATASAYPLYQIENEPLPEINQYDIILDSKEQAVCIIQNTKVSVHPFNEISEEHAFKEGEGDRSLVYWRKEHERLFTQWMEEAGLTFTESMPVVCEEFQVVYVKK